MKELINNIVEKKEEMIREFENGIDLEDYNNGINEDYMKGLQNGLDLAVSILKEDTSIDYKNYIIFILGYDLINKELKESDQPECDLAFKQCKTLMEEFINSKYDKDTKSLYECLEDFIEEKLKNI